MKKYYILLFSVLLSTTVFSQIEVEDSSAYASVEAYRDDVFRMDLQQVPSGILLEYSLFPFDTANYDGLANDDDILNDKGDIFGLLEVLRTGTVSDTAIIPSPDSLFAEAYLHRHNTGNIPLTFLYQSYHRVRQSALDENLLYIDSDEIGVEDVPNRTASPYDLHHIFAFAPFADTVSQFNSITFSLPQVLWQMQGVSNVEVDFDDGNGFIILSPGSTANVYYASEGEKILTARITAGGNTRIARSKFYYHRPQTFVQPDYTLDITADPVYTNEDEYLGGTAYRTESTGCNEGSYWQRINCLIQLGARIEVENGCDDVFDRPVIIVEGFDPQGDLNIQELQERFGSQDFRATLKAAGFDIVYVEFTNNFDFIENNAKVLEKVLDWVKQNKTGTNRSSVIGFSMGGLISRWCLKDMEDRGLDHGVENYFSYDAPHQGANIPLGMQFIFNEMEEDMLYLRFDKSFRLLSEANRSTAAKQMMVTRPVPSPPGFKPYTLHPVRAKFAERLVNKGYPQQTNNYGIAFGRGDNPANTTEAGNGDQHGGFGPGDQIYEGNLSFIFVNSQSEGYAVPVNGNTQIITKYRFEGIATRKIFGLVPIVTSVVKYKNFRYTGQQPYDDAPGGFERTQLEFAESLTGANGLSGTPTTFGHDGHNFLSTVSALDLQNQGYSASNDWQSDDLYFAIDNFIQNPGTVNGNTLSDPALSPFQAVVTSSVNQPDTNFWHNAPIGQQFSQFIIQRILNADPAFNCQSDSFCDADPVITGPEVICNSTATYTLNDLPNDVAINWSSQYNKVSVTNGQGTPTATFSVNSSESETIVATITSVCGASKTITNQVWIGKPPRPGTIDIAMDAPPRRFTASIAEVEGATSYNWYSDGVLHSSHDPIAIFDRNSPYCGGSYFVEVEALNACGASLKNYTYAQEPSCTTTAATAYSLMLIPNPSSNESTIAITSENEIITPDAVWDLEVYNKDQQMLYHERELKSADFNLKTNNLGTGIYLIRVLYKGEVLNGKLVVME